MRLKHRRDKRESSVQAMGIPASKLSDNRTILIVYFTQLWLVIIRYAAYMTRAGWSSPVARQAHNLKVVGSNPTPATSSLKCPLESGLFCEQRAIKNEHS